MTKGQLVLDNNYRLITDDYNFILQRKIPPKKKRTNKSKEWQNIGYWKDLSQALESYSRRRRREGINGNTLSELIALERALGAQIEAIGERCVSLWGKNPE